MTEEELKAQQKQGQVNVLEPTPIPEQQRIEMTPTLEEFLPILDKLRRSGLSGLGVPVGVVSPYAGTTDPTGWLICDGRAISRSAYGALFQAIGTSFGAGDGSTTFNIPDARSRVWVGYSADDPAFNTMGQKAGEKQHTLTLSEMPAHSHQPQQWTNDSAGHMNHAQTAYTNFGNTFGPDYVPPTDTKGSDAPHNNLQPYIVGTYIIKAL